MKKRICLFAAYDKNNYIHDYVIYYLQELSKFADIYYLAECEMNESELEKIKPYTIERYAYKHGKYDFGSWQELINKIGYDKLSEYDELILANDSCFAPMFAFEKFFKDIDSDKEWDLLGIHKDYNDKSNEWYLVSYFLIMKNNIFTSELFKKFINDIKVCSNGNHDAYIYESTFTKIFIDNGYKAKSYIKEIYDVYRDWKISIVNGSPFLKTKIFKLDKINSYKWEKIVGKNTDYNIDLIKNYIKSSNLENTLKIKHIKIVIKKILRWFFEINRGGGRVRILGIYLINRKNIDTDTTIISINKRK